MKSKRSISICAFWLLAVWLLCAAGRDVWRRYSSVDTRQVFDAVYSQCQDRFARGEPLPRIVTFKQLVDAGYLSRSEIPWGTGWRTVSLVIVSNSPVKAEVDVRMFSGGGHFILPKPPEKTIPL